MLPPGHIAGAFIVGKLAQIAQPALDRPEFLAWCAFFGFLPDLDTFLAFFKLKRFISDENVNHRKFTTHAPLLYLFIFEVWYLLFPETRMIAWAFLLGTWSHFLIDTASHTGIQWFYPFSSKLYSFGLDEKIVILEQNFFRHWTEFLSKYSKLFSAKLEAALIVIAILVLIYG
jgi:membrane-bound metal-dependent hydrolase YbcI (DUF457 family)